MALDCKKCKQFYITWDPRFPNGCRAFGIKSKQMPSIEVYIASGKECLKFQSKEDKKKS